MWLPIIEILEKKLNEGKSKKDIILENTYVKDVFTNEVQGYFIDAVFNDEKERLTHRDWTDDNPTDSDVQFYLSLTDELKDRVTDTWAYEYAFYALRLSMRDFLEEFESYIDSVHNMEEDFETFMKLVDADTMEEVNV